MGETPEDIWGRILAITASTLAAIAVAIAGYVVHDFNAHLERCDDEAGAIRGVIGGMSVSIAELDARFADHHREAEYWKERIEGLRKTFEDLRAITLSDNDPFDGSQGRALERRIDACERGLATINALSGRLDDVSARCSESETYYRSQIVPLIEHKIVPLIEQQNFLRSTEKQGER